MADDERRAIPFHAEQLKRRLGRARAWTAGVARGAPAWLRQLEERTRRGARRWADLLRHSPRHRWLTAAVAALLLAYPAHQALVSHPVWAAWPVNALHAAGLTVWRAHAYDEARLMPYHVMEKETDQLPIGLRRMGGQGRPGLVRDRGVVFSSPARTIDQSFGEQVVRQPVDDHVLIGTGHFIVINGHRYGFHKVLHLKATAYDRSFQSNGPWTGQPTKLGIPLQPGIAAVDPKVIPLGTWLFVDGYGIALAADTGSAIHGKRIDLFFDASTRAVEKYGIQAVTVYELDRAKQKPIKKGETPPDIDLPHPAAQPKKPGTPRTLVGPPVISRH